MANNRFTRTTNKITDVPTVKSKNKLFLVISLLTENTITRIDNTRQDIVIIGNILFITLSLIKSFKTSLLINTNKKNKVRG